MAIIHGWEAQAWKLCGPFPAYIFDQSRQSYPTWIKRALKKKFVDFSDSNFMEMLLKPKAKTGKVSISFMVSTNDTVKQIEVRPPQFFLGFFQQSLTNPLPTYIFHQAKIVDQEKGFVCLRIIFLYGK